MFAFCCQPCGSPDLAFLQFIAAHKDELFLRKPVACTKYRLLFEKSNVEGYLMPADDD